ncbi:DUF2624 domain-containing protein [Virgibacillus sp. MSP4-1]|uniref:DUF2624 domain-containing protein n=1 Tax=Virgibacillus sp. MSP4-1 TaxID=2700081 RepID=UPI0003A1BCCA|nr:DUF2624 domain-containing protein [Virgibacillus sp. MSP4-1]QHS22778.1 DUF2624 domain-containing protein [Virgibacillus sp. MSP4-1]
MKPIIRQMIREKLAGLTANEMIQYGKQYGFSLTHSEAEQMTKYIKNTSFDPFNEKDRIKILKKIAQIKDEKTARKANRLFKDLTKKYGVDHLF